MPVESFSGEAEDLILQRLLNVVVFKSFSDRTGFYVDIGANHPTVGSNTYFFYKRGWRGVNVEPNPLHVDALRHERPEDVTVNVGLADVAGRFEYQKFENSGLNGFYGRDTVDILIGRGEQYAGSIPVECLATPDFLKKYATRPIDFLSLDIEGGEFPVLRTWDWVDRRPKLICLEIHATTVDETAKSPLTHYLAGQGYTLMSRVWQSAVFVDNTFLTA